MATSSTHRGWLFDRANGRLALVYNGTEVFDVDANDITVTQAMTTSGVLTSSSELRVANGQNVRVGTISAFGTTEPTNAVVMFQGTEFAGAVATSGAIMSSATVLRKIIAAGTVTNIET